MQEKKGTQHQRPKRAILDSKNYHYHFKILAKIMSHKIFRKKIDSLNETPIK